MEQWNGPLDWSTGLDYWSNLLPEMAHDVHKTEYDDSFTLALFVCTRLEVAVLSLDTNTQVMPLQMAVGYA